MNVTIADIQAVIRQNQTAPGVALTDDQSVLAARDLMARVVANTQADEDEAHDKAILAELDAINNSYPTVVGSGVGAPDVEGTKRWRQEGILRHDKALAEDVRGWEMTRAKVFAGVRAAAAVALSGGTPAGYGAAIASLADLIQEASASV
jgi:hypothetical protein